MSVNTSSMATTFRAVGLAIVGLFVGAAGWLYALYLAAFVVGSDGSRAAARGAAVALEVIVIVGLTIGALRAPRLRAFLIGTIVGFAGVTLAYWLS